VVLGVVQSVVVNKLQDSDGVAAWSQPLAVHAMEQVCRCRCRAAMQAVHAPLPSQVGEGSCDHIDSQVWNTLESPADESQRSINLRE